MFKLWQTLEEMFAGFFLIVVGTILFTTMIIAVDRLFKFFNW